MKNVGLIFGLMIGLFVLSGCVHNPTPAAVSFVTHSGTGTHPVNDDVQANKVGKATCHSVFMLVSFGDCTIDTARENGGIHKIHSVENASTQILSFYGSYTTIVLGE